MRKLFIVYNPRSSQYGRVRKEVLDKVWKLTGLIVGKYEVKSTSVEDNAVRLAKLLGEGDLVVAAGGDGTSTIAVNGVVLSGKNVRIGFLGYGNFNDLARMGRRRSLEVILEADARGELRELWPLQVLVNGRHWRYALGYATMGMFAESTMVFDGKNVRGVLQKKQGGLVFSVCNLARWYFKTRNKQFLPKFMVNGTAVATGTTDYLAVNSRTVARMMRGGGYASTKRSFLSATGALGGVMELGAFMLRSMTLGVPGRKSQGDTISFETPATIMLQTEGEYQAFAGVQKIEVRKAQKSLKVL